MHPFALALLLAPSPHLTLSKGQVVPGQEMRYWAVDDVTIDSASPQENFGGDYELTGGPGKAILIRFGDLDRFCAGRHVKSARIVLTVSDGSAALEEVDRIKTSWGMGPVRIPGYIPSAGKETKIGPIGACSWRSRLTGIADWATPGATGATDFEAIASASMTKLGSDEIAIEGLGEQVEAMAHHWYDNNGFALRFAAPVMFDGSRAPFKRPRLELELEDAPAFDMALPDLAVLPLTVGVDNVEGTIKNIGTVASQGFRYRWVLHGIPQPFFDSEGLAPGTSLAVKAPAPKPIGQSRLDTVLLQVEPKGPDGDSEDNAAIAYQGGKALTIPEASWKEWSSFSRFVNETVFANSRFSFARDGVLVRINPVIGASDLGGPSGAESIRKALVQLGASDLRSPGLPVPYGAGLLGGETRCDAKLFAQTAIPTEPITSPILTGAALEPTDLLAMTDVAQLNGAPTVMPKTILLRLVDRNENPVSGADVQLFKVGDPSPAVFAATAVDQTGVLLPSRLFIDNPTRTAYKLVATRNGVSANGAVYGWQLTDAGARGNLGFGFLEVVIDLPSAAIVEPNVAEGKSVSDQAGDPADALAGLTRAGNTAPVTLSGKQGSWVEVDLGRDRTIGEIRITAASLWKSFDVVGYETGQRPEEALVLAHESDGGWMLANRGLGGSGGIATLVYVPQASHFRFLRLISRVDQPDAVLTQIQMRGIKMEGPR